MADTDERDLARYFYKTALQVNGTKLPIIKETPFGSLYRGHVIEGVDFWLLDESPLSLHTPINRAQN